MLEFNDKFLYNSEGLSRAGEGTKKIIESWDEETGHEALITSLKELENREGIKLNIDGDDDIRISFVFEDSKYSI